MYELYFKLKLYEGKPGRDPEVIEKDITYTVRPDDVTPTDFENSILDIEWSEGKIYLG